MSNWKNAKNALNYKLEFRKYRFKYEGLQKSVPFLILEMFVYQWHNTINMYIS